MITGSKKSIFLPSCFIAGAVFPVHGAVITCSQVEPVIAQLVEQSQLCKRKVSAQATLELSYNGKTMTIAVMGPYLPDEAFPNPNNLENPDITKFKPAYLSITYPGPDGQTSDTYLFSEFCTKLALHVNALPILPPENINTALAQLDELKLLVGLQPEVISLIFS